MKEIKTIQELKDFFEKDMNGYKGCVSFNDTSVYSVTDILRVIALHKVSKPYIIEIIVFEKVEEEVSKVNKEIIVDILYNRIENIKNNMRLVVNEQDTKKDLENMISKFKYCANEPKVIDSYDISEAINELKNKL